MKSTAYFKPRRMNEERKLIKFYPDGLSNPVLVKKKNDKWRV